MKIIFLKNGPEAKPLIDWLRSIKEDVIVVSKRLSIKDIHLHKPQMVISYNYRFIITKDVLKLLPGKYINLHISYLPWNRGTHPNLWSFLVNTPKGVTIHLIDKGVDTGDILVQKKVTFKSDMETLASTYRRLHLEIQKLFMANWNKIKEYKIKPQPKPPGGSRHYLKDFVKIQKVLTDKGWQTTIKELHTNFNEN